MLTEGQISEFWAQGFVRLEAVLDSGQLDAIDQEFLDTARGAVAGGDGRGRGVVDVSSYPEFISAADTAGVWDHAMDCALDITPPYMPFSVITGREQFLLPASLLDLYCSESLTRVLTPLLGGEITASCNQHSRVKLPNSVGAGYDSHTTTMWHQDAVVQFPESDSTDVVTCWIPMVDADEESGCLVFVPGMHHDERLLAEPPPPELIATLDSLAVPVPARRGDVVLIHKRTPHASAPHRGRMARWSLDLRFFPTGRPSDRPWYPSIPVASRDPRRIVSDPTEWRRRWDDAIAGIVASGQPLPGRPAFAKMFAQRLLEQWRDGEVPRAVV